MAGDTVTDESGTTHEENDVPTRRGPDRRLLVGGAAVLAVVAALVVWRVAGGDGSGETGGGNASVPYTDPRAAGSITLCSADGTPVTGGSVDDKPFAAVVLGDTGVPSGVDETGAVGTLFGYQPRAGIGPEEFSGIPLTAAGVLTDPAEPAVRLSADVYSVRDFVTAFPADQDGFVQLRLVLGTPEVGTLTENPYDTADLRVDGDRWELVHGGDASCADAASLAP